MRRIIFIVVAGAIILGVVSVGIRRAEARRLVPWPELLPNVRLEPARPFLKDADVTTNNAFYYIRQTVAITNAWPKEEWDRFEALGLATNDYPAIDAWGLANQHNMELWRQAAAMTNCQVATCDSPWSKLAYVQPARNLSRLLCIRAESCAKRGDWQNATDAWRTVLIASAHITRGGPLINHLLNFSLMKMCCESIRRAATEYDMPPETTRELAALLAQVEAGCEPLGEAMRYERMMARTITRIVFGPDGANAVSRMCYCDYVCTSRFPTVSQVGSRIVWFLAGSSPQATGVHVDAFYSHIIAKVEAESFLSHSKDERVRFMEADGQNKSAATFDDPIGRIVVGLCVPAIGKAKASELGAHLQLRGTRVMLALRLYEKEHGGQMPQALQELVPAYLDRVPADPFLPSRSLAYAVKDGRWTIYSVGKNGIDDGGRQDPTAKSWVDQPDICFTSDEFAQKREAYLKEKRD